MCSTPYDCHYPAYGGRTPRGDRVYGRVGSAFRDAAAQPTLVEGEYFEGEIIEGEIFESGQIIDGSIIEGEIMDGVILEGEIMEGEIQQPFTPLESEIIELPNTTYEIPSSEAMPSIPNGSLEISPSDVVNPSIPMSSPSPGPWPEPSRTTLPQLDRVFDGLPPAGNEAVIELQPAVSF